MPIYQTGEYRVKPASVNKVTQQSKTLWLMYKPTNLVRKCISPGSKKMIQPTFFIFSFSMTLLHKIVTANPKR